MIKTVDRDTYARAIDAHGAFDVHTETGNRCIMETFDKSSKMFASAEYTPGTHGIRTYRVLETHLTN